MLACDVCIRQNYTITSIKSKSDSQKDLADLSKCAWSDFKAYGENIEAAESEPIDDEVGNKFPRKIQGGPF